MPKKKEATQEEEVREEGVIEYPSEQPEPEDEIEEEVKEPEEEEAEPEKPPTFTFADEEVEESNDPETMEIVHRGQKISVPKEKVTELVQKGYDYDYKVGPHGKIAQMIEADPNLAQVVNNYWQGKTNPEPTPEPKSDFDVTPLTDYETEEDWLKANMNSAIKARGTVPTPQPIVERGNQIDDMLKMRDPANYARVLPVMLENVQNLSVKDYQRIDSDPAALYQYYDFIKNQVIGGQQAPQERSNPSFKVRSGGGDAPREETKKDYAWNLPKDKFRAQMEKIKGF